MSWHLFIKPSAKRELEDLPQKDQDRIVEKLWSLQDNPFPFGVAKLKGHVGYRLRAGDYRVLYEVDVKSRTLTVFAIGHRKEVYR